MSISSWYSFVTCSVSLVLSSSNSLSVASLFLRMDATLLLDECTFSCSSCGDNSKEREKEEREGNIEGFVVIHLFFLAFGVQDSLGKDACGINDILSRDVAEIICV